MKASLCLSIALSSCVVELLGIRSAVTFLQEGSLSAGVVAQSRMQVWYDAGVAANRGAAPDIPCKSSLSQQKQRYIFFERDMAGFNNVKLQLQSMVALAAVTGRTLVLPLPGNIDHVKQPYFEFDFFDAANLTKAVPMELHKKPDKDTLHVEEMLSQVDVRKLDKGRDWLFSMWKSRIQHFECLNLNKHDRALAAHAVLHGVVFDRKFEETANTDLHALGLAGKAYNCAHIRRGDFKSFAPQFYLTDAQMSDKVTEVFQGDHRPVLVASDERPELHVGAKVVHSSDAYDEKVNQQTRLALDMIMCSRAQEFVGSPMSTFTNGILELRRRNALLAGSAQAPATHLYAGAPEFEVKHDLCWNKQTTFEDITSCDKGAAACFTACPEHF